MKKTIISAFVFISFLFAFVTFQAAYANDLFEVTVMARGASREEALASAIDDAIRRSLGSIFAERTEVVGNLLEERLIQFSRGTATSYTILESSSDESGVVLTVTVTVDSSTLASS
jgi:hypothetical protein